jgi:DUF3052 family protein
MAGYSGTPLVKKLGIKDGARVWFIGAPTDFLSELEYLPSGVSFVNQPRDRVDLILLFVNSESELKKSFRKSASKLAPAGMLWVAWPKKSSGVATDLTFEVVQKVGLAAGLVDTKICAVNEVWSGLKFVIRLKDRAAKR